MDKQKTQVIIIAAMLPVLAFSVISATSRKKTKTNRPGPSQPLTVDAGVKVFEPIPQADSNVLETQKKHGELAWGRDPFVSDVYKSGQASSDLKLKGISYRKDNVGFAFINNEIVKKGDNIAGYEVGEVLKDRVLLKKGAQSFYLTFPEE
jgi:hypothetical protein